MRRAKLGDVYAIHVQNGYKIYQWAYHIRNWGKYIRVFDGLYDSIPENITEIAQGEHSYIIGFDASRAYRIGLAQFIGNVPVPDRFPFPQYRMDFWKHALDDNFVMWIRPTPTNPDENINAIYSFNVSCMGDLPPEFRGVKLLDSTMSPAWLLYLFDYNFSLSNLMLFWPQHTLGNNNEAIMGSYQGRVAKLMNPDKM